MFSTIWKMKKEAPKKIEKEKKPKPVVMTESTTEEEEMSVKEMIHGKRKQQETITIPKRVKTESNIVTKKFNEKDFKIFGAHKLKK